jgi:hypothetical protein
MTLTICIKDNNENYEKSHKTPSMIDLFSKTKSIHTFAPHWQMTAFLCHSILEKRDDEEIWLRRTRNLLKIAATFNIFTSSSFIDDNYQLPVLSDRVKKHLESTPQGLTEINMIPGYPNGINMFEENLSYILMPCFHYSKRKEYVKATFHPNQLIKDICDQKNVVINIKETVSSLGFKHDNLVFSLLAWIMSSVTDKNMELDIHLSSDLNISDVPVDLRLQMAISGINFYNKNDSGILTK